jgi:hypothetical protein
VSRKLFAPTIWFVLLTVSPSAFGQTDQRRLEDAFAEITLLKRALAEQDRRITDLQNALKMLQSEQEQDHQVLDLQNAVKMLQDEQNQAPQPVPDPIPPVRKSKKAPPDPAWHNPSAWTTVKKGMSRAQVEAILGHPTSVDTAISFQTLFYQGLVPGSGSVTGTVKLDEDRVWQVNTPVF